MATPATKLGSDSHLKAPTFQIGQKIVPGEQWERDFPFYRQQYALHLIRKYREIQPRICEYNGMKPSGGRIPEGNKAQIRECLRVFSEAKSFEVAGIVFRHGFNLDSTDFNACYLAGVPGAASPPSYGIQLLIRFKKDNNNLALVMSYPVAADSFKVMEE